MRKTNLNIWLLVCLLVTVISGRAGAVTYYVNPGDSIQSAIDGANNGDEIEVSSGTYYEAINFKGKAVRLYSSGGPDITIINASFSQPLLDNFDDGDYDGWEIIDQGDIDVNSVWSAETGQMVQSSNYANPPLTDPNMLGTYAWWQAGSSWTNYQVSLTMKSNDNDAMGVMLRYQDPNNYYRFTWLSQDHSQGIGRRQLVKFVDGQFEVLAHDDIPYSVGQEYRVRITAYGSNLSVHIDGQLALWDSDPSFQSGSVALYCWGNTGTFFDNIYLPNLPVVRCTSGEDADTILEGFTITGGSSYDGGGMRNWGSSPTVINCIFTANMARIGGGMNNYQSSPTVINCAFSDNTSFGNGGGMDNYQSSPTVTNCTFRGNSAPLAPNGFGGGMNNSSSSPTVTNCVFSGNSALAGGVMSNVVSSPMVTNCTFSNNKANTYGGGMYNYNSNPTVANCILWGDTPDEIYDTGTSSSSVNYCDIQGGWSGAGGNNIDADPCFVNAAAGYFQLIPDVSPCVDAGDNSALPADTADLDGDGNTVEAIPFDLDGNPRVFDGDKDRIAIVDMGAYEYREPLELVGHWKLDEYYGYIAYDSVGENHGTLYGGPPHWHPDGGQVGGALQLDGVDDYVDCGNDDSLNIVDEITLAVWVKTNDAGNREHNPYVMKGDYSYALKYRSTNEIEFFIFDGGWRFVRYDAGISFNDVWHHIAGTYDGNKLKLYIDGGLEATTAHTGSINISAYNVNIGRNSMIPDRLYGGMIDDVRIYNYALTDDEILYLSCTEPIKGDIDGNCRVDFRDFALLLSEWLTCNLPRHELCW